MSAQINHEPALFRREALQATEIRRYGSVLLATPASHAWLTALFGALATAVLLFLAIASYTRSAEIGGVLLPAAGVLRAVVQQSGTVAERYVTEGQRVAAGEVLFRIRSERVSSQRGDALQSTARLLQARRDSLSAESRELALQAPRREQAVRQRIAELAAELHHTAQQIEIQQARVALAEAAAERYTQLQQSGFVAAAELQDRQAELLDQRQRLADIERSRMADVRLKTTLAAELRDLQSQAWRDQQAGERSIASLDQELSENEAQREQLVRAAQPGTVSAITAERGQSVTAGQSLASIVPLNSQLEAELYAPSRNAGFLRIGMPVRLRYQSFPYQKFGQYPGRVREVSGSTMRVEEFNAGAGAAHGADMIYRVRVSLERQAVMAYGAEVGLKAGTAVDASITLDRRRLYEWLLEPLRSLGGRM